MNYSPIALFVYKRPEQTQKTIESLMGCPEFTNSPIYVFCDGAKKSQDIDSVQKTRDLVKSMIGNSATIIESDTNKGLATSIITGIKKLLQTYDKIIVVEDDLVVSSKFLKFLNQGLEKYQNNEQVMQISGHMFSVPKFRSRSEAIFLPFGTSWGWATWKRAWAYFDPDLSGWEILQENEEMRYRFNLNNNYNYFDMLERQTRGEVDSWAIRWYWSMFKLNGYCLFPTNSYVNNIGFDKTATHGYLSAKFSFKELFGIQKNHLGTSDFSLPDTICIVDDNFKAVAGAINTPSKQIINSIKKVQKTCKTFLIKQT